MAAMAFHLLVQMASGSLIMLYDPSHTAVRWVPQVRLTWRPCHIALLIQQPFQILERHSILPNFIRDPSPISFMLTCVAYAVAAAAFSSLHPNDQYRHRFLFCAVCIAPVLSLVTTQHIRSLLPPTITTASVLSVFTHSLFPSLRAEAIEEVDRVESRDEKVPCQEKQIETTS